MKKIALPIIILLSLLLTSCEKLKDKISKQPSNTITLIANGEKWTGEATAMLNDISRGGIQNAYILFTAYKEDGDPDETQFVMMLKGPSLVAGAKIQIKGGFNDGEFFGFNNDVGNYVSNNAPANLPVGTINLTQYDKVMKGSFEGKLYTESGEILSVTEGEFNVEVGHF